MSGPYLAHEVALIAWCADLGRPYTTQEKAIIRSHVCDVALIKLSPGRPDTEAGAYARLELRLALIEWIKMWADSYEAMRLHPKLLALMPEPVQQRALSAGSHRPRAQWEDHHVKAYDRLTAAMARARLEASFT